MAAIVAALVGVALYIRIYLPYDRIFINDWIWFRETDAFYYMRHIENMVSNFPRFNAFDPYMLYPGGGGGLTRPFFAWLVAGTVRLFYGASPAQYQIATVSACMPAVLGALTLIPVYFIGRKLFNRWAGVIAAALVAILPGEFLHRSLLGFTDHHVAEVLLSTTAILFLIMAVKRAREREISFGHLLSRDWSNLRSPLIYTLLAGIFLGFYLLSWIGGLLFIFVIFAYLVIQFIVDHLRGRSTDYLCIIGSPLFLIAFLMLLPVLGGGSRELAYRVSLLFALVLPVALAALSRLLMSRAVKPVYYPLALLGLVGIGLAVLQVINPSLLRYMIGQFGIFAPEGAALTVLEMHPLTIRLAWMNFTTSFFISFVALAMLAYVTVKQRSAEKTLLLVWCVIMLAAALGQRRFGYYFAVNAALLTGYFSWKMLDLVGLKRLLFRPAQSAAPVLKKKRQAARTRPKPGAFMQPRSVWIRVMVVGVVVFFLVFYPNIGMARGLAGSHHIIGQWLNDGWYSSSIWLRDNTPEPFADPDAYYDVYPSRAEFEYPETAYGVMSWWDYGYFIMQIGRRVPNANPMQAGAREAGQFFTSRDEDSAGEIADARGSRYIMIDHMMATTKFYAMVEWADRSESEFHEYYGVPPRTAGRDPQWLGLLRYPAYYESMVVRLYNFDGRAVTPAEDSTVVIPWSGESVWRGIRYKNITGDPEYFSSYEEAEAYVEAQESGNYAIGSLDPFVTPVPLQELTGYRLVHESVETARVGDRTVPGVKVFEYLGH